MTILTVNEIERSLRESAIEIGNTDLLGGVSIDRIKEKVEAKDSTFQGKFFALSSEDSLGSAVNFIDIHLDGYRDGNAPSMTNLAMHHAQELNLDKDSIQYRALILASALAEGDCGVEEAGKPDYHNVNHFLDVAAVTGNLLKAHEQAVVEPHSEVDVKISKHNKALTLITAIIHDVGHDGKGNPKEDPLYNEKKSFDTAKPLLEAAGLKPEDLDKIYTILLTTSPNGPHAILKSVAKAQREGKSVDWSAVDAENQFPELRVLEQDPELTQMASIVSDSDLFASSGAGFKASRIMSENLTNEVQKSGVQMDFNNHGARKFFLDNIVGEEGYASNAARVYLNNNFMLLKEATEAALGNAETPEQAEARRKSMQNQIK